VRRQRLLLAIPSSLLVLVGVDVAHAAGLNLGWGSYCPTSVSSMVGIMDPCDGTGSTYTLTGSARIPESLPQVVGEDVIVDFEEQASALSDYWHLEAANQPGQTNPAGCRGDNPVTGNVGSLVVSAANTAFGVPPGNFTGCVKFWGAPLGAWTYTPGFMGEPNCARLAMSWTVVGSPRPYTAGTQIGAFAATLDNNHQTSDPNNPPAYVCAGCQDGVCILFVQLTVYQTAGAPGGNIEMTSEDVRNLVQWQQTSFCFFVSPARRATWGQVKSLYR
jgi:hypothetical protein